MDSNRRANNEMVVTLQVNSISQLAKTKGEHPVSYMKK